MKQSDTLFKIVAACVFLLLGSTIVAFRSGALEPIRKDDNQPQSRITPEVMRHAERIEALLEEKQRVNNGRVLSRGGFISGQQAKKLVVSRKGFRDKEVAIFSDRGGFLEEELSFVSFRGEYFEGEVPYILSRWSYFDSPGNTEHQQFTNVGIVMPSEFPEWLKDAKPDFASGNLRTDDY